MYFPPPPDLTHDISRIKDQYSAVGGFGDVYKCLYHCGSEPKEVAVKALRFNFAQGDSGRKSEQMLRREIGIWRRIKHKNIVPFLGIAYGFGFLETHEDGLSVEHRLQFLLDTANGLKYLHSFQVPIVHGDLNSNNVLIDANYVARLADFGYASLVGNIPEALTYLQRSTTRPGALRWVAPEQIDEETCTRTTKSDIYSFGCVLSGKQPWSEVREDAAVVLRLARGQKPRRPQSRIIDDCHWDLIQTCWSSTEERPAAELIISRIQGFLGEYSPSPPVHDTLMSWSKQAECANEDQLSTVGPPGCNAAVQLAGLNALNPVSILVDRSRALGTLGQWEDALKYADQAIKTDPFSPWGHKRRHAALHGLQRYDEAIDAFSRMLSLIRDSSDPDERQLGKKYVSPSRSAAFIEDVIRGVSRVSPLVLIDIKSGHLCDAAERSRIFKSELPFKELVSSMTQNLDDDRIREVVGTYFLYVTLSHVWEGHEPSFQDVNSVGSVWDLNSSPVNGKLRNFCKAVRNDGYRWAWSDTCCIDKTIGTVLNQSLAMMYKWYEGSAATFVFLRDIESLSTLVGLKDSVWVTRAWASQELLAPKVIRFYDRNWKPYLGDTRSNHKESPEIMQELADAIGVARQTIVAFDPDRLSIREKLRLASTRRATLEEDTAYSLIGIFKSDIIPRYGEGDAALGHLLEEIVARSGEVTVLAWSGQASSYNSCLPSTLAVYSQPPPNLPAFEDAEMDTRVAELKGSLSQLDVMQFCERVVRLPVARFANRRLHLPCIIFGVKQLGIQDFVRDHEYRYRARVLGIGDVEFQTSERLPLTEPRRFILVHPWIRDLRDPLDGFSWENTDLSDSDSDAEVSPLVGVGLPSIPAAATMDGHTRALRLVVRLQYSFQALLLLRQPEGEFKRVAAEHEIVVPGIDRNIDFAKANIRADVVEIL